MTYGIATRQDAEIALAEAMRERDMDEIRAEYDADAIIEACYDEIGTWRIADVPDDLFWDIVRNNAR